jgi:hypothetical protein
MIKIKFRAWFINEMIEIKNRRLDALNLYSGIPQKNNTFGISKYIPSDSKDKNKTYYNFNNRDKEHLEEKLIHDAYYNDYERDKETKRLVSKQDMKIGTQEYKVDNLGGMGTMGNYKISTGKDKRGKYISYYDKWDLNPLESVIYLCKSYSQSDNILS